MPQVVSAAQIAAVIATIPSPSSVSAVVVDGISTDEAVVRAVTYDTTSGYLVFTIDAPR